MAWVVSNVTLQINISNTFTTVTGVESMTFSGGKKTDYDVTSITDTATQYVSGFPDFGTCDFTVFWLPADTGQAQLLTDYGTAGASRGFKILLPSTSNKNNVTFTAECNKFDIDLSKGPAKASISAKVSGAITVA